MSILVQVFEVVVVCLVLMAVFSKRSKSKPAVIDVVEVEVLPEKLPMLITPSPALVLPESCQGGAWSCCFLRLLHGSQAQLAGVPVANAQGCVSRLESLGAESVLVLSAGAGPLVVVSFEASAEVLVSLSAKFPSACAI